MLLSQLLRSAVAMETQWDGSSWAPLRFFLPLWMTVHNLHNMWRVHVLSSHTQLTFNVMNWISSRCQTEWSTYVKSHSWIIFVREPLAQSNKEDEMVPTNPDTSLSTAHITTLYLTIIKSLIVNVKTLWTVHFQWIRIINWIGGATRFSSTSLSFGSLSLSAFTYSQVPFSVKTHTLLRIIIPFCFCRVTIEKGAPVK